MLFFLTGEGMAIIMLHLSVGFVAKGNFCIATSFGLRSNPMWIWLLMNGALGIVLGGMMSSKWPSSTAWVIGVLYPIHSTFTDSTLLILG